MGNKGGMFSSEEIAYLKSLPAVVEATAKRITYSNAFKEYCMRRYAEGASPVKLFREAGLDPSLVGSKRIERCFARWREEVSRRGSGEDIAKERTAQLHGMKKRGGVSPQSQIRSLHSSDPEGFDLEPGRRTIVFPAVGGESVEDLRDLLIAQQVRRIAELERQVDMLRAMIDGKRADGMRADGRRIDRSLVAGDSQAEVSNPEVPNSEVSRAAEAQTDASPDATPQSGSQSDPQPSAESAQPDA
ncbi:HTH domain-containing protein [Bifidobacterium avesanii]|uniref:HTH domain-containing protein n=1 Tax=Bifidobacterium avesanii TaxID=1798157 RepID=UPI00137D47DE|nr:HTH domain-containing protein [Bifidobacterium avesanii]KAB8294577.1 hypothetical protein DSM100685_0370 [Bifidobacterium avesanii]